VASGLFYPNALEGTASFLNIPPPALEETPNAFLLAWMEAGGDFDFYCLRYSWKSTAYCFNAKVLWSFFSSEILRFINSEVVT
jgi:hypothetical protein